MRKLVFLFIVLCSVSNIQAAEGLTDTANRWAFLVDMVECAKPEDEAKRKAAIESWKSQMRDLEISRVFSYTQAEGLSADACWENLKGVFSLAMHRIPKESDFYREGKVEIHLYVNADMKTLQKLFRLKKPASVEKRAERVFIVLNCVDASADTLETLELNLSEAGGENSVGNKFKDNQFLCCILMTQNQDFCRFHKPAGWKPTEDLTFFELLREGLAGRCMLKHSGATHVELAILYEYMLSGVKSRDLRCRYNNNESFPLGEIKKTSAENPRDMLVLAGKTFTKDDFKDERESAEWRVKRLDGFPTASVQQKTAPATVQQKAVSNPRRQKAGR